MPSTVSVHQVVQAILNSTGSSQLVQRRSEFAGELKVPSVNLIQWLNSFTAGSDTPYDILSHFLSDWVERNGSSATTEGLSTILRRMNLVGTAETMSSLCSNASGNTQIIISFTNDKIPIKGNNLLAFGVKPSVVSFVGRTTERNQLKLIYTEQTKKIVVIWAMGGQGKTQLTKKFIEDLTNSDRSQLTVPARSFISTFFSYLKRYLPFHDAHPCPEMTPVVIWLKAESSQQLTASISKWATKVGISLSDPTSEKPLPLPKLVKRIISSVKAKYPSHPRWLVVFDNVNEEYSEFEEIVGKFFNTTEIYPLLIVTSRRNDIYPRKAHPLSLQTLSPGDAQELVRNALKDTAEEDVVDLCRTLDHHALALEQALAYISTQQRTGFRGKSYAITNFFEDFHNSSKVKTVLQQRPELCDYDHTVHRIVHTTLTFIQTNHPEMKEIVLELCFIFGLIHPDGIKLETLLKFIQIYHTALKSSITKSSGESVKQRLSSLSLDDNEIEAAIILLAKFSLVNLDNKVISVHRVVQTVLRLEHNSQRNFPNLLTHIHGSLTPTASSEELLHIRSIWSHADEETVKVVPNFAIQIFDRMVQLSLPLELMGFAEQNHTLLSKILGPEHKATLRMEHNVALALRKIGNYEKSLEKFKELLEKEERVLGKDAPSTQATSAEIGSVLRDLERYEKSLPWYKRVLKKSAANKEFTLSTRHNMALVSQHIGRVEEALEMHHEALEWDLVEPGPSHPPTLGTRHNFSTILHDQGRLGEAKTEFEEILWREMKVLGVHHQNTLKTKGWLADTIWRLGDKKEALEMMEEVLASREKVLGHTHPDTQMSRNRISKWKIEA